MPISQTEILLWKYRQEILMFCERSCLFFWKIILSPWYIRFRVQNGSYGSILKQEKLRKKEKVPNPEQSAMHFTSYIKSSSYSSIRIYGFVLCFSTSSNTAILTAGARIRRKDPADSSAFPSGWTISFLLTVRKNIRT